MPDKNRKFHEFALRSILFKGQHDWYFCYLKSERIAHVLGVLAGSNHTEDAHMPLKELVHNAGLIPGEIAHFAAGETDITFLLADIFSLLSKIRLAGASGLLREENALVLVQEYEQIAQKMAGNTQPSPFLSAEDFFVPSLPEDTKQQSLISNSSSDYLPAPSTRHIKDTKPSSKGHTPVPQGRSASKEQEQRISSILEVVKKTKGASMKDISAVIRGCSEKTIQRELALLIERGLIRKEGERRWSVYLPM